MIDNVSIIGTLAAHSQFRTTANRNRSSNNSDRNSYLIDNSALIGNFFKRKFEEINDNESSPNVGNDIQANDDVDGDASPNVDNENIQANDDVDASPNVDNDNPTTSIPTTRGIIDLNDRPPDPHDRPPITSYHPNQIDDIRSWLEYSIKADKVYCLYCYLFKEDVGNQGGRDTWSSSSKGFCDWSKKGSLKEHVGNVDSHHLKAAQKCHNLMNQKKHMDENMKKLTKEEMIANYYRLLGSVMSVRFCLENSLPFRGHDEPEESNSQGMFLSVLNLISTNHPKIGKYTLGNAKKNNKLTSPKIQKEIIECFSKEVTKSICAEIKDDVFGLLVDESSDVSLKEQMAVVVRFVDKLGAVRESLIGIVHVKDTTSITLKEAIDDLLASNQLSVKQVRGQGYDGASNMRGEFNGLKALILKDNPSAHYIHCFAHQLQLVIVVVAKKHSGVKTFYEFLSMVVTTVSASCKRKDMLREEKKARVEKELLEGKIKTGKGLNQEVSLARPGDTRWGSHYRTIISLLRLFPEVVTVLQHVKEDGDCSQQRTNAKGKDLLEAANLINGTKRALNALRQNGFEPMLEKVTSFCKKYNITMLDMSESYGNPRNRKNVITNRHHFEVDIFNEV
ncbi:zinc finger MYM-type protein 1-like [Helianthus annuus]|uniref:zinc finger MYM-type protein 1-like n=1 Tax=Helianthus annuus TaxID=4232 RepID=UPI000B8EFD83|nr:zinc finger MYM-type protein 1-like [Helianthus annuus]